MNVNIVKTNLLGYLNIVLKFISFFITICIAYLIIKNNLNFTSKELMFLQDIDLKIETLNKTTHQIEVNKENIYDWKFYGILGSLFFIGYFLFSK